MLFFAKRKMHPFLRWILLGSVHSFLIIVAPVLGEKNVNEDDHRVLMCVMPKFMYQCNQNPTTKTNIAEVLMLDITRMPFNKEQWFHLDFLPTQAAVAGDTALKIQHALVQISDEQHQIIGRLGEQVPCQDFGHPEYSGRTGEIPQLYRNPGPKNIVAYRCPVIDHLSFNRPPTVALLTWQTPVEAFYINVGFTKEEGDHIANNANIFVTTLLKDDLGNCHVHRVGPLQSVADNSSTTTPPEVEVPVQCHQVGPAFQMMEDKQQSPLLMRTSVTWDNVEFSQSEPDPRPREEMARVGKPNWRDEIDRYNLLVNGLDAEGYTLAERRELEEASKESSEDNSVGVMRRPNVPLVEEDEEAVDTVVRSRNFENDDAECDDSLRNKAPKDVEKSMASLYLDCKYSRQCMGEPDDCIPDQNCDLLISWGRYGDKVHFGVIADKVTYIAVGISEDTLMGNDSVTECVREGNKVSGYTSWNFKKNDTDQRGNMRLRSCESMKDFEAAVVENDNTRIFCSWKRPVSTKVKGITFNLDKPYHLLIAKGYASSAGVWGNIEKHEEFRVVATDNEVVMNNNVGKSPFQYILSRIHGITQIVTWMLLVPVATFASRYLKGSFPLYRIFRTYSVWYGLHLMLVTLAIALTLLFTVLIYVFNNYTRAKEESRWSAHAILGFVLMLQILVQGFLAFYLVSQSQVNCMEEWHLKYLHGMNGHLMTCIGYACIMTSRYVKDGLPCNVLLSFGMYLASFLALHLMMSYQICYSDFVRGYETSRVYKIFVVDHDDEYDQPRRPPPARRAFREAEALRRRRLTLDEIDVENLEDGSIINPTVKSETRTKWSWSSSTDDDFLKDHQEEPGAPMRKAIFVVFAFILLAFTVYYVFLMVFPDKYMDCITHEMLAGGQTYLPGHLYF